jgi:hypothetical protein
MRAVLPLTMLFAGASFLLLFFHPEKLVKRSLGLTLVGVLVILLSALFLAVDGFAVIAMFAMRANTYPPAMAGQPDPRMFVLVGFAFMLALCGLGIVNGIGLIKRWTWCRYVTIVFGFIAASFFLLGAIFILLMPFPPTPGMADDSFGKVRIVMAVFYFFWFALFLAVSLFLLRRKIAEEFRSTATAGGQSQPRPFAVWTVAGLLVFALLALPMMFLLKTPFFVLGVALSPALGRVVFSIWMLASGAIGIALFRRVRRAFWFAIGLYVFGVINSAVIFLPGPNARFQQVMQQVMRPSLYATTPGMLKMSVMMGILAAIVPLILLAIGRRRFFEWCDERVAVTPLPQG